MAIDKYGYELIEGVVSAEKVSSIIGEADAELAACKGGGIRNAEKKFPSVKNLAFSVDVLALVEKHLTGSARLVRAILFDKSPKSNWLVTWHQDITVAVSHRFEAEGWGPWSFKDGVYHVQPPAEVLRC